MVQATQELATRRPALTPRRDPAWQAFALLRIIFTVAPILFGLDKFFNILVHWPIYLYPNALVITEQEAMYVVGIVEIVAGLVVAIVPRYGSLLVVVWLTAIIVNLLAVGSFYDVALRDFGLLVGALALWRLSVVYAPGLPFRMRKKPSA
ncbi:hypothetical protein [Cryobacterium sp. BB307]|uniref:hypothetical protein n=1 Tax=Cryobacterium sp. BB307 TaxID=2716317 RepID=UPI0014485B8F|nr:hypothetical protein [Cryobacterium sp. BB307]